MSEDSSVTPLPVLKSTQPSHLQCSSVLPQKPLMEQQGVKDTGSHSPEAAPGAGKSGPQRRSSRHLLPFSDDKNCIRPLKMASYSISPTGDCYERYSPTVAISRSFKTIHNRQNVAIPRDLDKTQLQTGVTTANILMNLHAKTFNGFLIK